MISSEMPELLGICDRIYVMNDGAFVGEFDRGRRHTGKDHARHHAQWEPETGHGCERRAAADSAS